MAAKRPTRLPKAPLTEVVFELRWNLQGGNELPAVVHSDPGLLPLLENFTLAMKKNGFGHFRDMSPALQTGAYGIARRFYKAASKPFPLMQVGPGIFATNESSQYDWISFKKQIRSGVETLLATYPKVGFFSLTPNYLELRYVDAFDKSLVGDAALFTFLAKGTSLKFQFPAFLTDEKVFAGDPKGRFLFQRPLKGRKETFFSVDIASGRNNDTKQDVVRMETKIISRGNDVPSLKKPRTFLSGIEDWAQSAHDVTSPFFKALISPEVMKKFG